jgi:hypothetical protein
MQYNYKINDNGMVVTYANTPDYQTDVFADLAVDTITEAVLNQPFFLSIAPIPPHNVLIPTGFFHPHPAPRHVNGFPQ